MKLRAFTCNAMRYSRGILIPTVTMSESMVRENSSVPIAGCLPSLTACRVRRQQFYVSGRRLAPPGFIITSWQCAISELPSGLRLHPLSGCARCAAGNSRSPSNLYLGLLRHSRVFAPSSTSTSANRRAGERWLYGMGNSEGQKRHRCLAGRRRLPSRMKASATSPFLRDPCEGNCGRVRGHEKLTED